MDLPGLLDGIAAGRPKGDDVPHGLGWRSPAERLFYLAVTTGFTLGGLGFTLFGLIAHDATASISGLAGGAAGLMLSRMIPEPVPSPGRKWRRRGGGELSGSVYRGDHEGKGSTTVNQR